MTKNVVQRLQTIQQDLSTLISIYDIASKPERNDETTKSQKKRSTQEVIEEEAGQCSQGAPLPSPLGNKSYVLLSSAKQTASHVTRPSRSTNSNESMVVPKDNWDKQKPVSAPTALTETRQPNYVWPNQNEVEERRSRPSTAVDSYEFSLTRIFEENATLWYDCKSSTDCEARQNKIANYVSPKSNQEANEGFKTGEAPAEESVCNFITGRKEYFKIYGKQQTDSAKPAEESDSQTSVSGGSRPFHPRREKSNPNDPDGSNLPSSASSTIPKTFHGLRRDKPLDYLTKVPKRVSRVHKQRTPSPEGKKVKPTSNCKENRDEDDADLNLFERACSRQDEKSCSDRPQEKKFEKEKLRVTASNQVRQTRNNPRLMRPSTSSGEEKEIWVNEQPLGPSQSKEKLEKLKLSKEVALNLAKQLKEKYDELKHVKEELQEKLQKIEKENKKLSIAIKAAESSKKTLQGKIDELKTETKNKLKEQEIKAKHLEEENISLKTKIFGIEKQYSEKLQEKEKEIGRVQSERLNEIRNALKVRESCTGDLERLSVEKSDLKVKVEELQDLLNKSQVRRELLEEENRRLQDFQYRGLPKREMLDETNQELESIRQNSKDLEEHVKNLRKSVENFDEVQQKLIKQTAEYQQQMQSGLEEIEKLKNENSKLKTDLENEKDALLIKIKIIEDQQETIKQLKEKSEEVKNLLKKNESLERILNIEREEKLELEDAVEHLSRRKDELKRKIKYLESDMMLAPQEVVRDLQKTQSVLHELESQVQAKQKEWEFHLQCLMREKEQAYNVAEIATKKLMRITSEFQKQTEANKALQRVIAENLAAKEKM